MASIPLHCKITYAIGAGTVAYDKDSDGDTFMQATFNPTTFHHSGLAKRIRDIAPSSPI